MGAQGNHVLLTGAPGCGKTTAVRRVVELAHGRKLAGFYTREIRQDGRRVGFEAVGLTGGSALLAHREVRSKMRVGRYGVKLTEFEALLVTEFDQAPGEVDLYVIDEIGKMECYSSRFVGFVRQMLDGTVPVLATIAQKGTGFIDESRRRSDVELITVTTENRDRLPKELAERFCGVL